MTQNDGQLFLFEQDEDWRKEWQNMPEFVQDDLKPLQSLIVHFETEQDRIKFSKLVNQNITAETISIWFPEVKRENLLAKKCIDES